MAMDVCWLGGVKVILNCCGSGSVENPYHFHESGSVSKFGWIRNSYPYQMIFQLIDQLIKFLRFSGYWIFFCLESDPYRFCLDPDPYQRVAWIRIRIRNEIVQFLVPDPYQNDTDPPHVTHISLKCQRYWLSLHLLHPINKYSLTFQFSRSFFNSVGRRKRQRVGRGRISGWKRVLMCVYSKQEAYIYIYIYIFLNARPDKTIPGTSPIRSEI